MLNRSKKDAKKFASRTGKKWVDSKLIDYCAECDKKFTIVNRKHHCRQCGEVICNNCSPDRVIIGDSVTPVRICRSCFIEHQKFTSSVHFSTSGPSGSVDKDSKTLDGGNRHGTTGSDFHSRYEKIKYCYTSTKYHYGPAASQYFMLHIPREGISASAVSTTSATSTQFLKSVPIVVLIHGGFWKIKYGIDNSHIESLVPFFLSKGMAVCQIEYRRIGTRESGRQKPTSSSHSLAVSPSFLQMYPPSQLMYMHVANQLPNQEDNWERMHQQTQYPEGYPDRKHSSERAQIHPMDDEGGFPQTNEDVLQALRLLHHKCEQMNSTASGVDSFTHHYIAANGSRCISRLAKIDTSRIVLLGHSAGGYLALWASCCLQERKLPFRPLLCVAVAPVCNLTEAGRKRGTSTAVKNFLRPALHSSTSRNSFSSDADEDDSPSPLPTGVNSPLATVLQSACPSQLLPVEVPLILACGTNDSDIPIDMVEDFYWKAKEFAVVIPPPLSASPQQSTQSTATEKIDDTPATDTTDTTDTTDHPSAENLNILSNNSNSILNKSLDNCSNIKKDDLTTRFVQESTALPLRLLKMPDVDHYAPVLADHPAFLTIFDELFVLAPSLADIPDLDILQYRADDIRSAIEYNSNSKSSSEAFNQMGMPTEKVNSYHSLENIFEDDGTPSSVSESTAHREVSVPQSPGNRRSSSISQSPRNRRSHSRSHSPNSDVYSAAGDERRLSDCMTMTMDLVDTVEQRVDKLLSCSSSEDGSMGGYFAPSIITTPNGSRVRKNRASTQDSRDSGGDYDVSIHPNKANKQDSNVGATSVHDGNTPTNEADSGHKLESRSSQSMEDLELFSFPAPVNKAKRRSFILPKFR